MTVISHIRRIAEAGSCSEPPFAEQ